PGQRRGGQRAGPGGERRAGAAGGGADPRGPGAVAGHRPGRRGRNQADHRQGAGRRNERRGADGGARGRVFQPRQDSRPRRRSELGPHRLRARLQWRGACARPAAPDGRRPRRLRARLGSRRRPRGGAPRVRAAGDRDRREAWPGGGKRRSLGLRPIGGIRANQRGLHDMTLTVSERAKVLAEALPYIKRFHGQTVVIKVGGNAIEHARDETLLDVVLLRYVGMQPVLVHGGGPEITAMSERLGLKAEFKNGLRITDDKTMEVVKMVLTGKVSPDLVAAIHRLGGQAVGMSGEDGPTIIAEPLDESMG